MTRIAFSAIGETPFQKLLGYNPDVLEAWTTLGQVLETDGHLSAELKEQVRRTLAQKNGCAYCQAKGKPMLHMNDDKMTLAVGFADLFLKLKGDIPDSVFQMMQETFQVKELSELCAFITFTTASQYFGAMMNLQPDQ